MTGLVRKATLLGVCGLIFAGVASASVPDPTKSSVPLFVKVGGKQTTNPALADGSLGFTVTVRDFGNNPIAGANVEVNFQNCTDTRLCSFNLGAQTVDCINRAVRATTNAAGQVSFSILGGSTNASPPAPPAIAPGSGSGCVRIFAEGIQLGVATSVLYDQDGAVPPLGVGALFRNGVKGSDLPTILSELGSAAAGAPYRGRSDFSADGAVNGFDLAAFLVVLGSSNAGTGSGNGCSDNTAVAVPYCP